MLSLQIKKYDSLIQFFIIFAHLKPFIWNTAILLIWHIEFQLLYRTSTAPGSESSEDKLGVSIIRTLYDILIK